MKSTTKFRITDGVYMSIRDLRRDAKILMSAAKCHGKKYPSLREAAHALSITADLIFDVCRKTEIATQRNLREQKLRMLR